MSETECLLTKDGGKFLLLLDLLFVEDSAELIECILCVTAERRDILFSLMSMVPSAMADVVLLLALPLTGMERFGARPMEVYYLHKILICNFIYYNPFHAIPYSS